MAEIDLLAASRHFKAVYGQDSVMSNLLGGGSDTKKLSSNEMDEYASQPVDTWAQDNPIAGVLALAASSPVLGAMMLQKQQGALGQLSMLVASLQQASFEQLVCGPDEQAHSPTLDLAAAIQADKLKPFLKIDVT